MEKEFIVYDAIDRSIYCIVKKASSSEEAIQKALLALGTNPALEINGPEDLEARDLEMAKYLFYEDKFFMPSYEKAKRV